MKKFVFGTRERFILLDEIISDGRLHIYKNCLLPQGCMPSSCRIGFRKTDKAIFICIDRGIAAGVFDGAFAEFLRKGEVHFSDMDSAVEFFHSLQPLFAPENPPACAHAVHAA